MRYMFYVRLEFKTCGLADLNIFYPKLTQNFLTHNQNNYILEHSKNHHDTSTSIYPITMHIGDQRKNEQAQLIRYC